MPRIAVGQVSTAQLLGTVSTGRSSAGTTTTVSHTVTSGTDILIVTVSAQDSNDANIPITGVTFGGAALTKAVEKNHGTNDTGASIWYKLSPSVSTADVVVTSTGAVERVVVAFNLDGVIAQAPEATNTDSGTAAGSSVTLTTLSRYAIIIECASHKGTFSSIGTGQVLIAAASGDAGHEHNTTTHKIVDAIGSHTLTQTWGSSNGYSYASAAFAPIENIIPRTAVASRTAAGTRTAA